MNKFHQNILSKYSEEGQAWIDNLPKIIDVYAQKWDLTELIEVDNLSYNYVLSGQKDLEGIILKISIEVKELKREIAALKGFADYGAVPIITYSDNALLLKKSVPGIPLKKNSIQIACNVAKRLHQAPITDGEFLHVKNRLSYLDRDWPIAGDYLKKARIFKQEILAKYQQEALLHGDLHHDNIISDGDDYLVIDPKGVIGHPIHEVWAFAHNIEHDLQYIAEYFVFSLEDVVKCYYIHALLAACWCIEDGVDPSSFLGLLEKISAKFNL